MFNPGTPTPDVFRQHSFDHNLTGLEAYTSAADIYTPGHTVETTGHAFLDEIPVGKSLWDQFKEATQMDGAEDFEAEVLYRRLTLEKRRSVSPGPVVERRAHSDSGATHAAPLTIFEDETATPETSAMPMTEPTPSKRAKGKKPAMTSKAVEARASPTIRPTVGGSFTAPLPVSEHRSSSSSERIFPGTDIPRLLLYNWFLLRMDNIKILSSQDDNFNGRGDDFGLLKLLANTHEDRRWWTIVIDDLACPQCVEVLKQKRTDWKGRYLAKRPGRSWAHSYQRMIRPRHLRGYISKCSRGVHCDGGQCKVVCEHRHPKANNVTRFFHKLGLNTASRMRNILLETKEGEIPSADHLVSCVQNVGYYFPDVQNLEICFHFGDLKPDKDSWTRILCCLVQLEEFLPNGRHLRAKGLEAHTELMCGWARKARPWYHGRSEAKKVGKLARRCKLDEERGNIRLLE